MNHQAGSGGSPRRTTVRRRLAGAVATWAVATAVATGVTITLSWPVISAHRDLAQRGVLVTGAVTESRPRDHGRIHYAYLVAGTRYEGDAAPSAPNPPAEQLGPGEAVEIVYDPQRPQRSCACEADSTLAGDWGFALLSGWFLGAVATLMVLVAHWMSRWHLSAPADVDPQDRGPRRWRGLLSERGDGYGGDGVV